MQLTQKLTWLLQFFYSNQVHDGHGGAMYLDHSNVLNSYIGTCQHYNEKCSYFEDNRAEPVNFIGDNSGGAIYALNFSTVGLADFPLKAVFKDNRADHGSAMYLFNGSSTNIQNSYFIDNGGLGFGDTDDLSVIKVDGIDTEARIRFSTFANNSSMAVLNVANNAMIDLKASIVNDPNPANQVLQNDGSTFHQYCNIYHEINSVGVIVFPTITSQDPGFVDAENGNYHLKYSSVAVDRCDLNGIAETIRKDLDGDTRAIDMPDTVNGPGAYDAGADEYNDVIFKNDFEPGASSAG